MEAIKRGFKSIVFYWKRNIFITAAFFLMFLILLGMASIRENVDRSIEKLGRKIGAELIVRIRDAEVASYDPAVYFPEDALKELHNWEELGNIECVGLANARGDGVKEVYSESMEWAQEAAAELGYQPTKEEKNAGDITVFGVNDIEKAWEFARREVEVTQGEGISEKNAEEAVAVVSERFLKSNFIEIGEEITLVNTAEPFHKMKVKVAGTHSSNMDAGILSMNPMNYIYVPLEQCLEFNGGKVVQATVHVKEPGDIENISRRLQAYLEDTTGLEFVLWEDCMQYLTAITPLEGVQKVCQVMFSITYAILLLILFLVIGRSMLNKKKEMGIWLSLGEKKKVLFLQLCIESLIPALAGNIGACLAAFGFEKPIGAFYVRLSSSFGETDFYISKMAAGQIMGATVVIAVIMVLVIFTAIVRRKVSTLLRGENR